MNQANFTENQNNLFVVDQSKCIIYKLAAHQLIYTTTDIFPIDQI